MAVAKGPVQLDKPEDLDALWTQLNAKTTVESSTTMTASVPTTDTVKIKRSYEFAGQVITYSSSLLFLMISEEKDVLRDSAEAKAYFSSIHMSPPPNSAASSSQPVRRPMKRKSNLEEMAKGNKPAKLNVLEKSRLDWATFVDKEGINEDLKQFNKDGYVERQEFLRRTRQ